MTVSSVRRRLPVRLLALAGAAALTATGCGSDGGSGSDAGTTTAAGASPVLQQAQQAVEKASSPNGTYALPKPGPAAQKGKNVFVVACGLAAEACAQPAKSVQEAAKTLGWNVTVADGKFSPAGYDAGIRQAIAANADGIIVVAIDCPNARGALQAAKAKGIALVGVYAYDCSDQMVGGQQMFDATINSNGDPAEWALANSKLRAQYAIAKTEAKAKVISLNQPEFIVAKYWTKGFAEELADCDTCEMTASVDFTANDLVSGNAPQKLSTVLLKNPDANALFVTSDALLQAVLPAIRTANRPKMLVIANEGFAATQKLIAGGTVDAAVGIYSPWMGWSGADALNRVFAGEKQIPNQGLGYKLLTPDNVPGDGAIWKPTLDYESAFKSIWTGAPEA